MTHRLNKPLYRQCNAARRALLEARAAEMRGSPTPSERLFWSAVRGKKLGVVVRRQVPILGRFVADFYVEGRRIVIEIDGAHHWGREDKDASRDRALVAAGFRVVRFSVGEIERELADVLARLRALVA